MTRKVIASAGPVLLVAILTNHLAFVLSADNGVIRRDYWRFVELIHQYHDNHLTFESMFERVNGPFKSLFIPLIIIADGAFFDLNLLTIHVFSLVATALTSLLIYFSFDRSQTSGAWAPRLLFLPMAIVLLSPKLLYLVAHGQASLSIIRVAVYLTTFYFLSQVLAAKRPRIPLVLAANVLLTAAILLMGTSYVAPFWATTAVLFFIKVTFDWKRTRENPVALLVTFIVFVASTLLYAATMIEKAPSGKGFTNALSSSPGEVAAFYLNILGNSILAAKSRSALLLSVGIAALILVVLALLAFIRTRLWERTYVPAALILYSLAIAGAIVVGRWDHGPGLALARRYLADTQLWQVGVLWILACASLELGVQRRTRFSLTVIAGTLALTIIGTSLSNLQEQWRRAPGIKRHLGRVQSTLLRSDSLSKEELERGLGRSVNPRLLRHYVPQAIEVMKTYRLNVFKDAPQAPPHARRDHEKAQVLSKT